MKNLQHLLLFIGLIALLIYNIWDKLEERNQLALEYNSNVEQGNFSLPEAIDFSGEQVPLKEPDVREKLDEELHENLDSRYGIRVLMKRAGKWYPKIEPILEKYEIPDDFKYLVAIESAISNRISPAGAVGFWQFMDVTGREFGLEINEEVDERYDPIKSTIAACKFFRQSFRKFNNWTLVASSYNRGISGIYRALENQKVNNYYDLYLNRETAEYIYRVIAFKEIYTYPEKYNLTIRKKSLYVPEKLDYFEVKENITDLVKFSTQLGISYKQLKLHNPWLVGASLTVEGKNKKYFIAIPQKKNQDLKIDTEITEFSNDSIAD